jgi:hypothetical protein
MITNTNDGSAIGYVKPVATSLRMIIGYITMTDLYLIAHKVRGEPAFDVAIHMECPLCAGHGHDLDGYCHECDGARHWWIISTSGHRAFPYWSIPLIKAYVLDQEAAYWNCVLKMPPEMPEGLRDHYVAERQVATDLIKVLGLIHKPLAPVAPIKRRF